MQKEQPNYYAIIPANVRYDKNLTANSKLLYGEITALSNKTGECWASNEYFAELYNVTTVAVSTWISKLKKFGYIETRMIYKEGTKEILRRCIRILGEGIKENFKTPIKENFKDNNTSINNTSIIQEAKASEEVFSFEGEVNKLLNLPPNKKCKIVYWYVQTKNLQCKTKKEWENERGRLMKSATLLEGYSREEIENVVRYHEDRNLSWTLETIVKHIKIIK